MEYTKETPLMHTRTPRKYTVLGTFQAEFRQIHDFVGLSANSLLA